MARATDHSHVEIVSFALRLWRQGGGGASQAGYLVGRVRGMRLYQSLWARIAERLAAARDRRGSSPGPAGLEPALPITTRPPVDAPSWSQLARRFVAIYVPVAAVLVFVGRDAYFGAPMFEVGDYAANALQIERAKHLSELLGNYSRFGFNHPGPAFFYVYALGDLLFRDALHIVAAPLNGYLLTGALMQSAFFAMGLAILAGLARDWLPFTVIAAAIALVLFGVTGNPAFEIWPPYQLVLPFVAFLSAAIAVALGWAGVMPLLILFGGFLVHGHVAQPLFVLPLSVFAYGSLVSTWTRGRGVGFRQFLLETRRPHIWSAVVLAPFALTVVLDALKGADSNLAQIIRYATAGDPTATWGAAIFYVLSFAVFASPGPGEIVIAPADRTAFLTAHSSLILGWMVLLALAAASLVRLRWDPPERPRPLVYEGRRFVATYFTALVVATLLTLYWAKSQTGPLYAFNTLFFNGVLYVAALLIAFAVASSGLLLSRSLLARSLVAVCILAGLAQPSPFQGVVTLGGGPGDDSATELHESVDRLVALEGQLPEYVLLEFDASDWHQALGLALALDRHGVTFLVPGHWGFMFGHSHAYPGSTLVDANTAPAVWRLGRPQPDVIEEFHLGSQFAILSGLRRDE